MFSYTSEKCGRTVRSWKTLLVIKLLITLKVRYVGNGLAGKNRAKISKEILIH